jgi:hypothetical protein
VFRVFVSGDTDPAYEVTGRTAASGVRILEILSIAGPGAPGSPAHRTPEQAKTALLEAIRTTPPGPEGFTFIFDGHGLPGGIFMGGGAEGGPGRITPRELADAIIERRRRFGARTDNDVYLLFSCYSHDLVAEVGRLLGPTEARPLLYSTAEHGQQGVTQGMGTLDMRAMFDAASRARTDGERFRVGDLIRLLNSGQIQSPFGTNPTFFFPEVTPRNGDRPARTIYYPVAQAPLRHDLDALSYG